MIARLLVLAALLAGLVAWERGLARRAETERKRATSAVGRMLPQAELERIERTAYRIEWQDGRPPVTVVPARGTWRVAEAYGAPADVRTLDTLVSALTSAQGYVQTEDPAQAKAYGFGTSEAFRFSICGPKVLVDPGGDARWSVDVGRSRPGGDGAFLRPEGGAKIWAVDRDPRPILAGATRPGLPPLVDASLLGQAWLGAARGVERVFVDHADGTSLELALRPREVSAEELRAGRSPYEWIVPAGEGDASEEPLVPPQERPTGYLQWLSTVTVEGLVDPRGADELGTPRAKVTLFPPAGEAQEPAAAPLVLHVLAPLADGRVPVVNEHADAIYALAPGSEALVAPRPEAIVDPNAENPWDRALSRARAQGR